MGVIVTGGRGAPFLPSGMTKSGNSAGLPTTFTKITSWTADTSGYPGSSVVSDGLVVQGPRSGATVAANIVFGNSSGPTSVYIQIKVGTTVVASAGPVAIAAFGTVTATASAAVDVALGDNVTLEARAAGTGVSVTGGVNTWVRVTGS